MGILRKVGIRMGKLSEIGGAVVDLLTIGAVTAVAGTVGTIVVFNIASTAPADPVWEELRCIVGISFNDDEKCFKKRLSSEIDKVSAVFEQEKKEQEKEFEDRKRELGAEIKRQKEEFEALEDRRAALEAEKAAISEERSGLAGKLEKLEEIEKSSTSFTLFTNKEWKRGLTVTTGVEYHSFVRSQEWKSAWCYVNFKTAGGLTSELKLGGVVAGGPAKFPEPAEAVLAAGSFSREDVVEAQKLCAFPKGSS